MAKKTNGRIRKATGTRKFNGKTYGYATSFRSKREAKHWAKTLREKKNVSARVVEARHYEKGHKLYRVYARSRRKKK